MHTVVERVYAVLSTTPQRWQQLVSTFSADPLTRPPAPKEWSALDCLQHLLDAERFNFPVRFQAFFTGHDFAPFDPTLRHSSPDLQTPEQLLTAFTRTREANLALPKRVNDDDLERTARHPQFGTVTLAQLLHTWAAHDLNHTIQAERALMQPFIRGGGPWHVFFRDHIIDGLKEEA